jgi:hypothetical protein
MEQTSPVLDSNETEGAPTRIELFSMPDGTGFTGLLNLSPTVSAYYDQFAEGYGMRRVNVILYLYVYGTWSGTYNQYQGHVFKGVQVTRLQ